MSNYYWDNFQPEDIVAYVTSDSAIAVCEKYIEKVKKEREEKREKLIAKYMSYKFRPMFSKPFTVARTKEEAIKLAKEDDRWDSIDQYNEVWYENNRQFLSYLYVAPDVMPLTVKMIDTVFSHGYTKDLVVVHHGISDENKVIETSET